jgi:hypothetical protein
MKWVEVPEESTRGMVTGSEPITPSWADEEEKVPSASVSNDPSMDLASKRTLASLELLDIGEGRFELQRKARPEQTKKLAVPRGVQGKMSLAPVRTTLAYEYLTTSGAPGALTTVLGVQPALFNDFASYAALYDEMKVHAVTYHWALGVNSGTVGSNLVWAVIAYDPVNDTALASVAEGTEYSQHDLVFFDLNTSVVGIPNATYSRRGYFVKKFKVPQQVQVADSINVVTGQWAETVSNLVFGYVKPYIPSLAGSAVCAFSSMITLDISFRSRR